MGGVTRDNFTEVLIEFERYLDSDEYNVDGDGVRTVSNDDWNPKAPIYNFMDWHDSRRFKHIHVPTHSTTHTHMYMCILRFLAVLQAAKNRGHHLLGFIPQTTLQTQPNDVQGFDSAKEEVANIKAVRNLIGDQDRYVTANCWVNAIKTKW